MTNTLDELEKLWEKDCKIDETNIIQETTNIPKLHSKYYKFYVRNALKTRKLKAELTELEKAKTEYYNGSMSQEDLKERGWKPFALKVLRNDIAKYIESDKDIIELSLKISYYNEMTKFCEDIIKQINTRNFLIKSIIDWSKFVNGGS